MKNNTYSITKEQILSIYEKTSVYNQEEIKEWFPEAFESEIKLEVGKWYKDKDSFYKGLINIVEYNGEDEGVTAYGFEWVSGNFVETDSRWVSNKESKIDLVEATEEQVFEALKKEAVKRGYHKDNVHIGPINGIYNIEYNNYSEKYWMSNCFILYCKGKAIFKDGKWVEIIPTITKEEAEKELGKKII